MVRRALLLVSTFDLLSPGCSEPRTPVEPPDGSPPAECLDQVGVVCTIAGTGEGDFAGDGGPAAEAALSLPLDIAFFADGTPYLVDFNNHRIRAIDAWGAITTVAGSDQLGAEECAGTGGDARDLCLNHPTGVAFDRDGQMLIAGWHNSRIFRIAPDTGIVTGVFGTGRRQYTGEGGPAVDASFDTVSSVAASADGGIFVMDQQNQVIRFIDQAGAIDRYAGRCIIGDDGPALEMRMAQAFGGPVDPTGHLALDQAGALYFSDAFNRRVRVISPAGVARTVAGNGESGVAGDGGPATAAQLMQPADLALAADGTLFIADPWANCIRRVAPGGTIDTVAGACGSERSFAGEGDPAAEARFSLPFGVALSGSILYIADTGNHRIRALRLE